MLALADSELLAETVDHEFVERLMGEWLHFEVVNLAESVAASEA